MTASNANLAEMKRQLAAAKDQSRIYLHGDALPARDAVRALVAAAPDASWDALSDEERFFLHEISPQARGLAAPAVQARALCAGLSAVSAEWWGVPGSTSNELVQRFVALGGAAAACLRPLLDGERALRYHDGEANSLAKDHGWIAGDLAAGIAAAIVGQSFEEMAPPDARARRRSELAQALAKLAP
jgi:hypothetical protein